MTPRWNVQQHCLELFEMPFYWRLSETQPIPLVPSRMAMRITPVEQYDYLEYRPTAAEWDAINLAYQQNANIGFLNPESGQMNTYGSSVNRFFLEVVKNNPVEKIYEIGCGAGFSIQFLAEHGFDVIGIDPSEYSLQWSERLGFRLLNTFFDEGLIDEGADLLFCNDVFEHVPAVDKFCRSVYRSLKPGGIFCFATTNSSTSIALGDISMLEHQHVNMFTTHSIYLLLQQAGFSEVTVSAGSYGNTFHVVAKKGQGICVIPPSTPMESCRGFFERAGNMINHFENFYKATGHASHYYVPLRCIPYLATVGDYGRCDVFDSNTSWRGKYIDGYERAIKSVADIQYRSGDSFFIGSITFYQEIKSTLLAQGYPESDIYSVASFSAKPL